MDRENIRSQLSEAVMEVSPDHARLVADARTDMSSYPVSFLHTYQMYKITYFAPTRSVIFYVGFAPEHFCYFLTTNPHNFVSLAQADGVALSSPEQAMEYATTYLAVTRVMSQLFYQVDAISQVKFRPGLSHERLKIKEAFELKYTAIIRPSLVQAVARGYQVSLYALRKQTSEEHTIVVGNNGTVHDHSIV